MRLIRLLLSALRSLFRSRSALELEILALRPSKQRNRSLLPFVFWSDGSLSASCQPQVYAGGVVQDDARLVAGTNHRNLQAREIGGLVSANVRCRRKEQANVLLLASCTSARARGRVRIGGWSLHND